MKSFFQNSFEYTHHCNQQVIETLIGHPVLFKGKISVLTSHTLNAHHIWNHRILGALPTFSVWQELGLKQLKTINTENFEKSIHILHQIQLNENISYTNTKGQAYTNSVIDILFHIINHSTYHRGQLISLLKEKGLPPLITDYIFYKR